MDKSIILPWSKENIESKTPAGCGVLMLRSTPVNGDIIIIQISEDLRADFLAFFAKGMDDVKYFDWYSTSTPEEAKSVKEELVKRYHLTSQDNI